MPYLRPDVYIENVPSGAKPIQSVGTSTGAFIGVAPRGTVGVAQLVTSWSEYVSKYAHGLATPFLKASDLSYAVYGFFLNGGGRAYIVRVASDTKAKATAKIPLSTGVDFTALDEGSWGNEIEVTVTAGTVESTFDITVEYNGEIVEVFEGVVASTTAENYYVDVLSTSSKFVTASATGTIAVGTGKLSGGLDGVSDLADSDYVGADSAITALDPIDDISLVAIPGQTSDTVLQGILDYCAGRKYCFGILDIPYDSTTDEAKTARASLSGDFGAIYHPWGKVSDPLSKQGRLRAVPPSGHVMGVYARTITSRGTHKAPAGLDAQVRGFVEMCNKLSNGDLDTLNPLNINCIVAKPNMGIVVWGARTLSSDADLKYVPDVLLDIEIKKSVYLGTQWVLFEPHDEKLWSRVNATVKAFLYTKWQEGALMGANPEEAYFVKCDGEINPEEVRKQGKINTEVGYAKKTPAEFAIFKFSQKTAGK